MGEEDVRRQALNVFRMELLGATVHPGHERQPHAQGRDQRGAARLGHERARRRTTCIGSVVGPHPYPMIVRDFQRVIGDEARAQILGGRGPAARRAGRLRRRRLATRSACSTRSSTTTGVRMVGVEAGGAGHPDRPAGASLTAGVARGPARQAHRYVLSGRRRPDLRGPLDLGGPRLPRRRARARLPQGRRAAPSTWP